MAKTGDHGVYAIELAILKKVFIGRSMNMTNRWNQHRLVFNRGKSALKEMNSDWDKHKEAFVFIPHPCDKSELLHKETQIRNEYIENEYSFYNDVVVLKSDTEKSGFDEKYNPLIRTLIRKIESGKINRFEFEQYLESL